MKSESEQIITGRNGNLKNALIEAGVRLLCEEGVEKLSLRRVAASCGVSHGAPYNHFIDKHDFLLTIQSYILNELKKASWLFWKVIRMKRPPYSCGFYAAAMSFLW